MKAIRRFILQIKYYNEFKQALLVAKKRVKYNNKVKNASELNSELLKQVDGVCTLATVCRNKNLLTKPMLKNIEVLAYKIYIIAGKQICD